MGVSQCFSRFLYYIGGLDYIDGLSADKPATRLVSMALRSPRGSNDRCNKV